MSTTHAIILAGGRSSRLAATGPADTPPKPLLTGTHGRLLDAALIAADFNRRVVVGPAMDLPAGVERVRESPAFAGPAAAIAAGVTALTGEPDEDYVVILAGDMPFIELGALLEAAAGEGAVAVTDGRVQPLLCVLRLGAARRAFEGVTGGSVMRCLDGLDLARVEMDSADVDTWDEAAAAGFGVASGAVSWVAAREAVARVAARLGQTERRPAAVGLRVASDVVSPMPVPHYTSSAMDGFAVAGAGPWRLLAPVAEGAQGRNIHRTGGELREGEALPILTGSLLPDAADRIIRSEHATLNGDSLSLLDGMQVDVGADIRHAGEELAAGDVLVRAGTVLRARHLPLLAACGVDAVEVSAPPVVDMAFTGNEVITAGVPGPGEVRDAFSASFPALVEAGGGAVGRVTRLPDSPDEVRGWLEESSADIVLVTGGSGHSSQDFARVFITELADELLAESVHCQPGHPTLIARRRLRSGREQIIIGVPGNPLAAHVAFHSFVEPALAAARGLEFPAVHTCRVGEDVHAIKRDRVRLIPAGWTGPSSPGSLDLLEATPMTRTNSHMLSGYAHADCLLVVPPEGATAGGLVSFLPLP